MSDHTADVAAAVEPLLPLDFERHDSETIKDAARADRRALARKIAAALLASKPIAQALAAVEAVARVEALVEEDTRRRRECREADDCSCSYKDCYECGKWHNCAHTPYTELRDALRPEGDPR